MRLETGFMRELLMRGAPHIAYASAPLNGIQRQGIRALYTFFRIARDTVDKAASRVESQISVQHLNQLFEDSNVEDAIDEIPALGLAWEAWLALEEEFQVPRSYGLEFARGLRMEAESFRPETVEDLLTFCYRTGGVLGLVVCHILNAPETAMQSMVDAGSAARLSTLASDMRKDFSLGRVYVPLEWFSRAETTRYSPKWATESERRIEHLAFVLFNSSRDAFEMFPFPIRIGLSVASVLHREKKNSVVRRLDRVIDEVLRQTGRALLKVWRSITAVTHNEFPQHDSSIRRLLPQRDVAFALRNQNLRLGRDL